MNPVFRNFGLIGACRLKDSTLGSLAAYVYVFYLTISLPSVRYALIQHCDVYNTGVPGHR
jgi:hypothetical protein